MRINRRSSGLYVPASRVPDYLEPDCDYRKTYRNGLSLDIPEYDIGPRNARGFMPPFSAPFQAPIATPGGAAVNKWWLSGGISAANCVAAYQPKGAASLAASYINLANPGTYDAAPGVAPTFDAATGWTFDGLTQYLVTGIIHANNWSVFVQFTNGANTGNLFGALTTAGGANYLCIDGMSAGVRFSCGSDIRAIGAVTSGNLGVTNNGGYVNGVLQTPALTAPTIANTTAMIIGARSVDGTIGSLGAVKIGAWVICDITHPDPLALSTAMSLL